jgi:thiamine biosynthesis lipoprotein
MYRRDFLHPRQFAHAAVQVLGAVGALPSLPCPAEPSDDVALVRLARRCMATTFEVVLPFGTPDAVEIGRAAFDHLDRLEAQLTVYRDTSEVCQVNRLAAYHSVSVDEKLFELLRLAKSLFELTAGAFDVTAGALIKAWGFYRRPRAVPDEVARLQALDRVGMQHVVLDDENRSVRFLRRGLELNLGSIGKGFALDCVAAGMTTDDRVSAFMLQGGSSSVIAKGTPGADRRGWPIDLRHPWNPGERLAGVWLRDKALGTSAATFQYIEHEGRKLGHLLDPRTGWPASGVASASVIAASAAEADALSTAFFVGGPDLARLVCRQRSDIGAVILTEGDSAELIRLNLPQESY